MNKPTKADFTLKICDGSVAMSEFMVEIKAFFDFVSVISEQVVGKEGKPNWFVSIKEGSQVLELRRDRNTISDSNVKAIEKIYKVGIRSLEKKPIIPPNFPEKALSPLKRLSHGTGQQDKNKTRLKLLCGRTETPLTQKTEENIDAIIKRIYYQDYGSIEGKLQRISSETEYGLTIGIRDEIFDDIIVCEIDDSLLENVMKSFNKRVIVSGWIRYNKKNRPKSVKVKNIRDFPDDKDIPRVDDFDKLIAKLNG